MQASELIEKENQKIPEVVRSLIETLGNPTNRAIVLLLAEKGELSFKELLNIFGPMNVSTINYHLKSLISAGAIENHYKKTLSKDEYSFYAVTEIGMDFLKLIGAKL
ncbi:MAG: helix-turn-helix transcriptional regulator [Nitrososphaerota archaeon]|nr:helix-turn-helix transcriptional regulator [Nitrososphaerota archaeon]